jgi:hypothetical protein
MVQKRKQATGRDHTTQLGQQTRDAWAAFRASQLHDSVVVEGVKLKRGEVAYCVVEGAELIEPRRAEPLTVTDTGLFAVTNKRCVFVGSKRSTEWAYSKLLEYALEGEAVAIFTVSNRQKATGVRYTVDRAPHIDATIAAAIARSHGEDEHAALVDELEQDHHKLFAEWEQASSHVPPTA